MIAFFHPGDLGLGPTTLLCLVCVGILLALTFGLIYLSAVLAKKHGEMWEKRLEAERKEKTDD